jgi:hypothetical protein
MAIDNLDLNSCWNVNGYHLIEDIMQLKEGNFKELSSLGERYHHALQCNDCLERMADAYEESVVGNSAFDFQRFYENIVRVEIFLREVLN